MAASHYAPDMLPANNTTPANTVQKPRFVQLCVWHGVDALKLHRLTGVYMLTLWAMLLDHAMPRAEAGILLNGLNEMAGTHYQLEDIRITFDFEQEEFLQHGWKD